MNISPSYSLFFKSYFVAQKLRGGGELFLLKNNTVDGYAYKPAFFFARGTWHFGDFRNIFLSDKSENHKKSYRLSAELLALRRIVNPAL